MAELVSPGVSISVTDESFYAAAGTGTVPLIVIATAQDKTAPDGSGVAAFTTASEADKVKLITSQRELLTNYGNPIFKTSNGTPLPGHELNEYGLIAAYSFLGLANRAYVLRANINLDELAASATVPTAEPADGAYWLDSASTVWGLKRWNGSSWVRQTVKVPAASDLDSGDPKAAYGVNGDFAVVYVDTSGNTVSDIKLYEKIAGAWYHIGTPSWDTASGADYQVGSYTALPSQKSVGGALQAGDILLQVDAPNNGTAVNVKVYSTANDQFTTESIYGAEHSYEAYSFYEGLGGVNTGDLWLDVSADDATVNLKRHNGGDTVVAESTAALTDTETPTTGHSNGTIAVYVTVNDRDIVNGANGTIGVTFANFDSDADGNLSVDDMVEAFQSALSAADNTLTLADQLEVTNASGRIRITSSAGYDVKVEAGNVAGFDPTDLNLVADIPYSNWEDLSFETSATAITGTIADGTLWYDSVVSSDNLDLLYNNAGTWESYPFDVNVAASQPTLQSDGVSALVTGDVWVSSADLENYPRVYKWSGSAWAEIDTTDQVSEDGIIFADFRASENASLDSDAPNPALYPFGILGWNKRASGGNIKEWDAVNGWWEDYSGNKPDGSPYMLRKAQRAAVVRQMQAVINSNTDIRNESNRFNLIACPGYPELLDDMITLNVDRKETAFIIADAPLRLKADATSVQNWATNSNNAAETGEDGLVTSYAYAGVYYPHGLTSNLDGTNIVVPGSHIALRTLAFNDQVAFPWFAPAGFQRGIVTNASSVGYIDAETSEYVSVSLSEGQRDALYINKVNPIGQFPGRGLAVFGQKTLNPTTSALDRVNVARLVVYIRERLDDIVKPFLFEPNDEITRQNAKVVVDRFLGNLVAQRGLFDFLTVCDTTNNTPARIDRNELYIDIAIQPVKAVEFIYIPIRIQNTLGETG